MPPGPPRERKHTAAVGAYVREIREQRGLLLRDVAQASGLSIAALSKLELGERHITVDDLMALGPALDTAPTSLLSGALLWA